ncbi:hypothetical protein P7H50_11915 [Enterococcus durans]|uniref:hypothetical protein n=1 Tax=Enterococcus durans TaxID=53345 RepID=UPI002890C41E|nr:hypothetical protein [Enterococcus durans]MDT2837571.1 hypothetical protein [Enterococcus durans]
MRRTKKEFLDYNEYRDRPFGLKWGTAFAMDELMSGIKKNEAWAIKEIQPLTPMSREEIDAVLLESFLYHKKITLQRNTKDKFGRYLENVEGTFTGEAYDDYLVLEDTKIYWSDIRHIEKKEKEKWFTVAFSDDVSIQPSLHSKQNIQELEQIKDEFYQQFPEEE